MSIKRKISNLIKHYGAVFSFKQDDKEFFFNAYIQPYFRSDGHISDQAGYGTDKRYLLYLSLNEITNSIKAGDIVSKNKNLYRIHRIETLEMQAEPIYRKAMLLYAGKEG